MEMELMKLHSHVMKGVHKIPMLSCKYYQAEVFEFSSYCHQCTRYHKQHMFFDIEQKKNEAVTITVWRLNLHFF